MNKIFTQLVEKRCLNEDFLHPKYENLTDPNKMPDMAKAVERISRAKAKNEKILIYGDYDVDGVTASTVMEDALRLAGVPAENIEIMLPDRFIDGYGMSPRLITRAREHGVGLVITVDCGSRNHAIVEELNTISIDTIVTDHHECEPTLPDAVAVVNPHRKDYTDPGTFKNLAGVGVAFEVALALTQAGLIKKGQEKWLLDLVLLGTICDSMVLTGENRILGYYGVKVLEKTRRPGLQELMKNAGVKKVTSESIGFQIGPRLNAAGRLETAELSLNLLRTASRAEAASLAMKLEELNNDRRTRQRAATKEISERLENRLTTPVIIEVGDWHEGILGIVAGRIVEQYHRPAFVLTEVEGGILKGSGRSFGEFNLADALAFAGDAIIGGGGHAAAAGVKLELGSLYKFRERINEYYLSLHLTNQERFLKVAPDLSVSSLQDFTLDLFDDLKLLEPFGPGNTEPVFELTGARVMETRRMGQDGTHLRLDLRGRDGKILKCIAFNAPSDWFHLDDQTEYRFLVQPIENEWNGTRSIEARLIDII